MSLAIDVATVTRVLLADGWHAVGLYYDTGASTFDLDAYEYTDGSGGPPLHGNGEYGVCATGFRFRDATVGVDDGRERWIGGPLTAIVAVGYTRPAPPRPQVGSSEAAAGAGR